MNKCVLLFSCLLASSSVCADIQVFDRYIENGKIYPHLSDYLSLTPHLERIDPKHVIDYSDALRRHRQEWERIETPENKVQMLQHVVNAVNKILKYSEDGLAFPRMQQITEMQALILLICPQLNLSINTSSGNRSI